MTDHLTVFLIECTQCHWKKTIRPTAPDLDMPTDDCPAQACSDCGSEATQIRFLHEHPEFIRELSKLIGWPDSQTSITPIRG